MEGSSTQVKTSEAGCYFKFCFRRPHVWPELIWYSLGRVRLRVKERFRAARGIDHKHAHYSHEIRKEVLGLTYEHIREDWIEQLPSLGWSPGTGPGLGSWSLPLASYSISFDELNWQRSEADVENTFALHRFIWLLRWLSLRPAREDLVTADSTILDWIKEVGGRKDSPAWETYSASERVVNWLMYFCATRDWCLRDPGLGKTISQALVEHLNHIAHHLEYYGEAFNNHILNDARALYFGGRLLQLPKLAGLGRKLFQRHMPELIDQQGVVREGSAHYQLLLTRTLVEVLWIAQMTSDQEFANHLELIVPSMVNQCLCLGSLNGEFDESFPRVGDVSPDFPVSWFYPDPSHSKKLGNWWGLWELPVVLPAMNSQARHNCFEATESEWKVLSDSEGAYQALAYVSRSTESYPPSHGHLDFGSFLLYDSDGPLLVDRGRYSYRPEVMSIYGLTSRSHNTSTINGLPLLPDSRGIFNAYREYLRDEDRFEIRSEGGEGKIFWQTRGVARLAPALKWKRVLCLKPDGVQISESVFNPKRSRLSIESYLHWAPGWELGDEPSALPDCFEIVNQEKRYQVRVQYLGTGEHRVQWFNGSQTGPLGWHFPEYGSKVQALTFLLSLQTSQNCVINIELRPI